jgi:hypothetical protein
MEIHIPEDAKQFIGIEIQNTGFKITEYVGKGMISYVFKAEKGNRAVACKVILDKLKPGWDKEITKVQVLEDSGIESIVPYIEHGAQHFQNNKFFTWILWRYVKGMNLKTYILNKPERLTIAFIENLALRLLEVIHACQEAGFQHGDLHEGNILVSDPTELRINNQRQIWVTDFGMGGSHNNLIPKNDKIQFYSIIKNLLNKIESDTLEAEQKILHHELNVFLDKKFLEEGESLDFKKENFRSLYEELKHLSVKAKIEVARKKKGERKTEAGDYLAAEMLGEDVEEWKDLFVPELLAAKDLLSKNITILTGARGCGKTMAFRRLTLYMDKMIGQHSGVAEAENFVGFYLNSRSLVEAFPEMRNQLDELKRARLIHYFHLAWLSEICKTLSVTLSEVADLRWLEKLMLQFFPNSFEVGVAGENVLLNIRAFVENEKEKTRFPAKDGFNIERWTLARYDFLDIFMSEMRNNIAEVTQKPFYFFLDDYTIPTISRQVQKILNSIIFKRRSHIFFKISTEAINSFEPFTEDNKPLELNHDYELIDLSIVSLDMSESSRSKLLDDLFNRRINREDKLKGHHLTLVDLLGHSNLSNNQLALAIREHAQGNRKAVNYYGIECFEGVWSSDIRRMIQIFVDMIKVWDTEQKYVETPFLIKPRIQNDVLVRAGRSFLEFTLQMPDPKYLEMQMPMTEQKQRFGEHMKDIVEAFIQVSSYELKSGPLIKNQDRTHPKQAFKIEVLDHFNLQEQAIPYYEGLVRYHIFLGDRRGKSVRGTLSPRLYLNRVLIPHGKLTFSKHDNIHLTNSQFNYLLINPQDFVKEFISRKWGNAVKKNQIKLDLKDNKK